MQDKKKMFILVSLGALMVSVGAFQFTKISGGETVAPAPAAAENADKENPDKVATKTDGNDLVKGSYPERDPFQPLLSALTQINAQQPNQPTPPTRPTISNPTNIPGGVITGQLPPVTISPEGVNGGGQPGVPPVPAGVGYNLAGIIIGEKPAAVFIDAQGAQRLVQLHGSLDGDTVVTKIDRRSVTLRVGNTTHTLTLGGEPQ